MAQVLTYAHTHAHKNMYTFTCTHTHTRTHTNGILTEEEKLCEKLFLIDIQ